jgi:hypothetical protein
MTTKPNPLSLADVHLDALYDLDAAGCIAASRDPDVTPPLFHLVRTSGGNRWLIAATLEPAHRERLASILSVQPPIVDCAEAQAHAPDLDAVRAELSERLPLLEYRGPAFLFPDQLPTEDRVELLTDVGQASGDGPFAWLRSARQASHPIAIMRAHNGDVASICFSARSSQVAAEAGVETREQYRGRGYGSIAVVAWAAAVRQGGRMPLYSAQWENIASRALASRIGLICYAEDVHLG